MNNTDNSSSDEQQSATIPTDYRALLAMTRPLVIAEHTLSSWRGGEMYRSGFGTSPGQGDWRAESTLRRGEILRSEDAGHGTTNDEELATTSEQAETSSLSEAEDCAAECISALLRSDSNLQIRICIGMS
jgi:hypothetical protein